MGILVQTRVGYWTRILEIYWLFGKDAGKAGQSRAMHYHHKVCGLITDFLTISFHLRHPVVCMCGS